ncbi:MAG: phospholipase D-like domain-containing protein [Sphingorhabdus sp.]
MPSDPPIPLFRPGENCWRIERSNWASIIIDAADYYHFIREVMEDARERIIVLGWDFDTRISLEPLAEGQQETLGRFFLRLVKANPSLCINVLKWSFGAKKQFLNPRSAFMLWRWWRTDRIDFKFDGAHPAGCSHHQKIVILDDCLAVCGGIDIATGRWDRSAHAEDEKGRVNPSGFRYKPWHDVTFVMNGPIAAALGELGRDRWCVATKKELPPPESGNDTLWPEGLPIQFSNVDIAIARTRAAHGDVEEVREIDALWLDMIAATQRFLYIENQYLTSAKIAAAIAKRLAEADPPEFVFVMPRTADGWLEQRAMDAARVQLARVVAKGDPQNRFRIYVPVNDAGSDIYVHAKVAIMDDRILRVGSANLNNRSLGLDSECDVVIDCALPANAGNEATITGIRKRLMAEHLGCDEAEVAAKFAECGSLVKTIEALSGSGKTLEPLDLRKPGEFDAFIAENELLDPESPDKFLEPIHKRSIWKNWRKGWFARRQRERAL